ncbi:hypothetical protein [Gimesia aquarii]|uniref:Uncharacterized protein n=1 Tax=Gimesia aquarii TaxID=2527964 RepID=A0A517WV77_9PLAN|nr:hypothetical protein [Gimesia aquarii]QDU09154.1 hypothetical protein V202x_25260 [Gimesia aquarii]
MNYSEQESVLIVGDYQTLEMRAVLDSLNEICSEAGLFHSKKINTISEELEAPALIIICQNWPDEFDSDELGGLISRFPISRFICCYGVWCESDGRTRTEWPLSVRVPARSAHVRIRQEWDIVHGKAIALPLTAGRDEVFQSETFFEQFRLDIDEVSPLIQLNSGDCHYKAMLEELILSWKGQIAKQDQNQDVDLLIVDLDPWELVVGKLSSQDSLPVMIGVMGLAHPEIVKAAKQLGIEVVVCKVGPEQALFQAITRVLKIKATPQAVN